MEVSVKCTTSVYLYDLFLFNGDVKTVSLFTVNVI